MSMTGKNQDMAVKTPAPIAKISHALASLNPDSLRAKVLTALRNFRASWIELGRHLNEVVYGGDYKEWGYDDFEVYCARELGLKKPTVQKLMVSYNYMRKYETKRLDEFEEQDTPEQPFIPDFQTVELLDKVRRREQIPSDEIEELHGRAFKGEEDEPELRKELRHCLRPVLEAAVKEMADDRRRELNSILRLARELRKKVYATSAIPSGLKERIERCLVELEALD